MTGLSVSATTSRMMWMLSASRRCRWVRFMGSSVVDARGVTKGRPAAAAGRGGAGGGGTGGAEGGAGGGGVGGGGVGGRPRRGQFHNLVARRGAAREPERAGQHLQPRLHGDP